MKGGGDLQSNYGGDDENAIMPLGASCAVSPHAPFKMIWDLCSISMVGYDFFMIPMSTFQMSQTVFLSSMDWVTRLFWTLDMCLTTRTGVVMPNGSVNYDSVFILKKYASTWLALDIFIVATDWLEVLLLSSTEGSDLTGVARIFRVVRIVRLVRLFRIGRLLKVVAKSDSFEKLQSTLSLSMSVVALLVCVFCFSHVNACVWWGIGGGRSRDTWVTAARIDEEGINVKYLVSLHWSLSQFTGGMDEVVPANALERAYAVVIWQITFMAAALIVSILTSNLTQQHITNAGQKRQMTTLTKYLNQNDISSSLMLRMERSALHSIWGELSEDTVDLLSLISEPLKMEMHWEMYSQVYSAHPYFQQLVTEVPHIMRKMCHHGTSTLILQEGDEVFATGETPTEPRMYIVGKGSLEYLFDPDDDPIQVGTKKWLSEGALWTNWTYCGTLTAVDDCKLVMLDAATFQDLVSGSRAFNRDSIDPKTYAADFVQRLNDQSPPTDLPLENKETDKKSSVARWSSIG